MRYQIYIFLLALSACAYPGRERDFDPALCESGLSYQAGFNDGREGLRMNSAYAFHCREDLRTGAVNSYKEGYDKGYVQWEKEMAERRKEMAEMQRRQELENSPPPLPSGPTIIIGGGGAQFSNPRAWFCEVRAFTDRFSGYGATQVEAEQSAKRSCSSRFHQMHCDRAECRLNR